MNEPLGIDFDARWKELCRLSRETDFKFASASRTWEVLRFFAASKPGGHMLEIGGGTGFSTYWLLEGMSPSARLISLEMIDAYQSIARHIFEEDDRVIFEAASMESLDQYEQGSFDLIFADGEPGKYIHFEKAIDLLSSSGLYIIDDIMFRPHWNADHCKRVSKLVMSLYERDDGYVTLIEQGDGVAVFLKR